MKPQRFRIYMLRITKKN